MSDIKACIVGVKISVYMAEQPADRLLQLTVEETNKPDFPKRISVFKGGKDQLAMVISVEPDGVDWTWPKEFDDFRVSFP